MKYYFLKLNAPRKDFMQTMTDAEKKLMQEHGAYLAELMKKDLIACYGPVADPKGPFGMGVFTLPDEVTPESLMSQDPTILSNSGFSYEVSPMLALKTKS